MAPVTITATGYPVPTLLSSALPPGIRFTDNRNGTGTLAGTPEPSATGQHRVVITASNKSGIARQTFDLAIMRVKSRRSLVLLAGQSNAGGWESYATDPTSGIDYLAAPYSNEADLSSTLSWMPSDGLPAATGGGPTGQVPLDTPQELFNSSGGSNAIFGPEIGWARQTYANTGQALSVVKAAFAGASLAEDWNPTIRSGDYANMIAKISSTMSADAGAGQLDTIAGIAWYQGERDAQHLGMAAHYRSNLIALIAALRSDLPMDPTVAIVLVKESLAPGSRLSTDQALVRPQRSARPGLRAIPRFGPPTTGQPPTYHTSSKSTHSVSRERPTSASTSRTPPNSQLDAPLPTRSRRKHQQSASTGGMPEHATSPREDREKSLRRNATALKVHANRPGPILFRVARTVLGHDVQRVEDPALLTGEAQFLADIPVEGLLHAVFVRSTIAHGTLRGVDTAAAAGMPGVVAALTADDLDLPEQGRARLGALARPLLARDRCPVRG